MIFDCLIIGGGVSGMQCALVIGSAKNKPFAIDNNVLGLSPKTLGKDILIEGKEQLSNLYPHISQIEKEKVLSIEENDGLYTIITNLSSLLLSTFIMFFNTPSACGGVKGGGIYRHYGIRQNIS